MRRSGMWMLLILLLVPLLAMAEPGTQVVGTLVSHSMLRGLDMGYRGDGYVIATRHFAYSYAELRKVNGTLCTYVFQVPAIDGKPKRLVTAARVVVGDHGCSEISHLPGDGGQLRIRITTDDNMVFTQPLTGHFGGEWFHFVDATNMQ